MKSASNESGAPASLANLEGQMLIAMPALRDGPFARAVVYLCAHREDGAMGIIVNQKAEAINFPELLVQLDVVKPDESIVLPARAVTTTAVSTGASSRARARATTPPTIPSAENCRNATIELRVNAMPVKRPTSPTMKVDPAPMNSKASKNWAVRKGGRKAQVSACAPSMAVVPRSSKKPTKGAKRASIIPARRARVVGSGESVTVSLTARASLAGGYTAV